MDKNYYFEKVAKQHQHEVSQELANRQLLKNVKYLPLKKYQKIFLGIISVIVVITLLFLAVIF